MMDAINVDFSILDKHIWLDENNRMVVDHFVKWSWANDGQTRVLIIHGSYMTGKTHLLRALTHLVDPVSTRLVDENGAVWGAENWLAARSIAMVRNEADNFKSSEYMCVAITMPPITLTKLKECGVSMDVPPMVGCFRH